ncbi:MAG: carboxypeptidase regulatory-like domain-containing protein [Flavobacteriales bacterium]|nr:carboxypeptidase regulatory-like domain-containing protein [Flavobacteriales bacterium]
MLRKIYLLFATGLISSVAFAQTGTLKGTVLDALSGEAVPFANVIIERNGSQTAGTTTDFDGKFTIKPIEPGIYTVKATFVGYQTFMMTGLIISANKITFQDLKMSSGIEKGEVTIVEYKKPLIDQDNITGETKTAEEIVAMPTRSVASVAATTAGIYQKDEGEELNVRGSRSDATDYYIDGIKVRGTLGVPQSAIEQITVMTGGLPAQYGDATAGIISITTKGPSNKFYGGAEIESSSLFDKYNKNLFGLNMSGPIWKKRNDDGTKGSSVIGYFLSAEFRMVDDNDPSAIGNWKVKDDVLADLKANPFRPAPDVSAGFLQNAEFVRLDDLEKVQARQNVAQKRIRVSGKLDFKPSKNTYLSLGGNYHYDKHHNYTRVYSVFNSNNNRQDIAKTWRVFGKLTQKFGAQEADDKESASTIKNAFFTIQADYTRETETQQDDSHNENVFEYGYIGKFETLKENVYDFSPTGIFDTIANTYYSGYIHSGWRDTLYTFSAGSQNPDAAIYTTKYYEMFSDYGMSSFVGGYGLDGVIRTPLDLQGVGLRNGERSRSIYSLWYPFGREYNYYGYDYETQTTFKASGSADIKDHEFSFGIEYEQRLDASWGVNPIGLWGLMRQLTNKHLTELDLSNPHPVFDANGIYKDTVYYDRLYVAEEQAFFDRNLREKLGKNANNVEWIDIDFYDPDMYDLDMFSADELLNNGGSYVSYYGYDYLGNKFTNQPSFDDFLNKKDANGNYTRPIAAFQPIYTAGYIQDKFAIEDLIFNVGLRVDRYDANQKVLKDKYLLYDTYTASSTKARDLGSLSQFGEDYYVYVDDIANPSSIVGYRSGDSWYDHTGAEISDPDILINAAGGKIAPMVKDPTAAVNGDLSTAAFKDYDPQTILMPRVAFSFPISDEAQFFAHYDVLTQRPPQRSRFSPTQYYFLEQNIGGLLNNPDLKPEKTVDYEIGFAQTLSLKSALTISLFYKELRDMIQVMNLPGAYPGRYMTMQNLDFGTVKGLSIAFDLRRTNNVSMTANYTLQFADGTGSSATSGFSLANTEQPNLRTTTPLSFDQRHTISLSVDYHYGAGKKYDGPVWFGKKIFQNAGFNALLFAGSGTPFSKQANITQEAAFGINDRSTLEGSIFGSRLPWQFRISTKVNKEFEIKWNDKKKSYVNVYLQVQNLLNTKNIISVYRATGNPEDDGYLTSAAAQNDINTKNNPDSFVDLYSIKVNDPSKYSLPRMMNLGLTISF